MLDFYYDEQNNKYYITRETLEKYRNDYEIEMKPTIINDKNYYSITKEQIDKINNKDDNNQTTTIIYKDELSNTYYIPVYYHEDATIEIMNKPCKTITSEEIERLKTTTKPLIVSVYLKPKLEDYSIILCNFNNTHFINKEILTKYKIDTTNKKIIRIVNDLYIEVTDKEIEQLKENATLDNKNIIYNIKNITPKN